MTGVCFCLNAPAPFGFAPGKAASTVWACSTPHIAFAQKHYGKADTMAAMEQQALDKAGEVGGAYLESIRLFDLASLSPEQYATLIKTIIDAYRDEMARLCEPF